MYCYGMFCTTTTEKESFAINKHAAVAVADEAISFVMFAFLAFIVVFFSVICLTLSFCLYFRVSLFVVPSSSYFVYVPLNSFFLLSPFPLLAPITIKQNKKILIKPVVGDDRRVGRIR